MVATMTWLTVMEYLSQMITDMFHFPVLSSFMTYHGVCNQINTTGATSGAGTANTSGAPEFTPVFSGVCVTGSLVLCVCLVDRCLFFWPLCCVLPYTDSDYPFGILDIWILITPLWYLRYMDSDYPPLVSQIYGF